MKSFKLVAVFILWGTAIFLYSCKNSGGAGAKTDTKDIPTGEISVYDFEQKLNATTNAQIIDVRTPEEFESGHLVNAVNIDWNGSDFDAKVKTLEKSKPTFVYCLSGGRSHEAAAQMKNMGFNEIYEMEGGIRAWNKAGKNLVTGDKPDEKKGMSLENYNKQINTDKLVLVDFNAPWCGPCKKMAPTLEEISNEQKESLQLIKINSDDNEALTTALKVENLPTLFLYKKGKQVWKHEGFLDKIALMVAIETAKTQ